MSELEEQVQNLELSASYSYIFKNCDYKDKAYQTAIHNITNHMHNMSEWPWH